MDPALAAVCAFGLFVVGGVVYCIVWDWVME